MHGRDIPINIWFLWLNDLKNWLEMRLKGSKITSTHKIQTMGPKHVAIFSIVKLPTRLLPSIKGLSRARGEALKTRRVAAETLTGSEKECQIGGKKEGFSSQIRRFVCEGVSSQIRPSPANLWYNHHVTLQIRHYLWSPWNFKYCIISPLSTLGLLHEYG